MWTWYRRLRRWPTEMLKRAPPALRLWEPKIVLSECQAIWKTYAGIPLYER